MAEIIRHTEIVEAMHRDPEKNFSVGDYIADSYDENLYKITDFRTRQLRDGVYEYYVIKHINPATLETFGEDSESGVDSMKNYYHVVEGDITRLRDMAHRIINEGASIEDFAESSDTSLMVLGDKRSLVALRSQVDAAQKGVTVIKNYCKLIHHQMMRDIQTKIDMVQGVVEKMNREIKKLDYVIQTIETYAGIKEEVLTLIAGEPAPETEPIVIRQAVLFMDEEFALIDDDFDWQKIGKFDDWLRKDENFKTILPDAKSIVAIKPRRTDKKYSDNWWNNIIMNKPNHVTLFLIRNGENLYRLESEHIYLNDRMFPNLDEYQKTLEEEQKDHFYELRKENDELKSDKMRRTFTKIAFLLQGLVDRSDVFAPHHVTCSFLKMEGLDDTIRMEYELDTSHLLQDGHPSVKDWMKMQNESVSEGSRILLLDATGMNADCFFRYYNKGCEPAYPTVGVYSLKKNPQYDEKANGDYWRRDISKCLYVINYLPSDDAYSWENGFSKRKNKVAIGIRGRYNNYLAYDNLKIEELDYYLNSRIYRSQYYEFVRLLKTAKSYIEREQAREAEFVSMLAGEVIAKGLCPKDGLSREEIAQKALQTVKDRLKWKRPISSKERETYTLVRRTLFSENYRNKYFKPVNR